MITTRSLDKLLFTRRIRKKKKTFFFNKRFKIFSYLVLLCGIVCPHGVVSSALRNILLSDVNKVAAIDDERLLFTTGDFGPLNVYRKLKKKDK